MSMIFKRSSYKVPKNNTAFHRYQDVLKVKLTFAITTNFAVLKFTWLKNQLNKLESWPLFFTSVIKISRALESYYI